MLYPIAIEQGSDTQAFGVVVPDIEGVFSAGDTFEGALVNAKEAIEMHLEALAELGEIPPETSSVNDHYKKDEFSGWIWAMVDIDTVAFLGKSSKINITLPNLLIKKIDKLTQEHPIYKNRSQFLRLSATHELQSFLEKQVG